MKAFWWFKENEIAGMARPGFNCTRWFDFPFQEAVLVGWIGQHPSGSTGLGEFRAHVQSYGAKILKFYRIEGAAAQKELGVFNNRSGLKQIFSSLAARSQMLESYDVTESQIYFEFNKRRLDWEVDFLKQKGIGTVVSLTESHHSKEELDAHFDAVHFSINDLDAPRLEQVELLAQVLQKAKVENKKVAVHCLAGIGRTSTMLIGAQMVMGEKLDDLKILIARQNPAFVFAGKQTEFLHSLAERLAANARA